MSSRRQFLRHMFFWFRQHRPNHCFYCGVIVVRKHIVPHPRNMYTRDHVFPAERKKTLTVPACFACNNSKSDKTFEQFCQQNGMPWGQSEFERFGPRAVAS